LIRNNYLLITVVLISVITVAVVAVAPAAPVTRAAAPVPVAAAAATEVTAPRQRWRWWRQRWRRWRQRWRRWRCENHRGGTESEARQKCARYKAAFYSGKLASRDESLRGMMTFDGCAHFHRILPFITQPNRPENRNTYQHTY